MAKVTLIRPPSVVSAGSYIGSLTPPIGLAYLASALRHNNHQVSIVDAVGMDPEKSTYLGNKLILRGINFSEILNLIPEDTDLIGFSGMFSSEWTSLRPLVNMIGEKFSDKYYIGGGEHFTAVPEISLEQCPTLDAVCLGEGEETIVEIANAIDSNSSWDNIDGLVLRSKDKFIKTNKRVRITKLHEIKKPAWDLVPVNNYLDRNLSYGVNRGRSMPMLASRGCPFQCTFCSSPYMWGTRWVSREIKSVVDEIEEYIEKYKITNVDFYDLTAIVKKSWIVDFCKELIHRNLNITWQLPSGTRSEAIDEEVTPLLYQSGCRNMNYAPESGSEKTLKLIKKKVKLDRMIQSLKSAVKSNINVKINIIFGFPHETHYDFWLTWLYLIRFSFAGAHDVSVGVFAPYPGSELYDELLKRGKIDHSEEYWQKLAYVDISETKSYCDNMSSRTLLFYNWLAITTFYSSNYLFRPMRLINTIKNLITSKHESRGEMALAQIFKRINFVLGFSKKN